MECSGRFDQRDLTDIDPAPTESALAIHQVIAPQIDETPVEAVRQATLTAQTREDNARFFSTIDEVPRRCVTQGLGTIMDSHAAVLVATGENKADAVAAMVEGCVSAQWPASILQFHPRAVIIIDEAAASKLKNAEYFRQIQASDIDRTGVAVD